MKLLTATALSLGLVATGAAAEQHMSDTGADMTAMTGESIRSRDITGGTIYFTASSAWNLANVYDELGDDFTAVREIEDIVLSQDGSMTGIVAQVGGFLEIADKYVLISIDQLDLVAGDDYAFVTNMTEEELESQNGIDEAFWN